MLALGESPMHPSGRNAGRRVELNHFSSLRSPGRGFLRAQWDAPRWALAIYGLSPGGTGHVSAPQGTGPEREAHQRLGTPQDLFANFGDSRRAGMGQTRHESKGAEGDRRKPRVIAEAPEPMAISRTRDGISLTQQGAEENET
jgi:hypothetical protein